jgi:catechol 2,3-dioxygenase-like lactoylglutathione lyase family enzyme
MIINQRHVSISVLDMDVALAFYVALGAVFSSRDLEEGPFIEKLLGVNGVQLHSCKLIFKDLTRLELMQFVTPIPAQGEDFILAVDPVFLGMHHLAFTVSDIHRTLEIVSQLGGRVRDLPIEVSSSHSIHAVRALHAYAQDPFGNFIHLAEDLDVL